MALKPSLKFWIFLLAIVAAIFAVILGSFVGSWLSLAAEDQELVRHIYHKLLPFPLLGALLLVVIIGTLVSLLFRYYVIPILQLADKARLITTVNPGYRIAPNGARELHHLTTVINDAAEAYQRLQLEVDARIEATQAELNEERNRLAALMSELPSGVLVCNTGGQILLYNQRARQLLQQGPDRGNLAGSWIGLGRSIFGILDRGPIADALELQQQAASKERPLPPSSFLTTLANGTCLRVRLAPSFHPGSGPRELSGFVLTIEDMTRQLAANARQERRLHELEAALEVALARLQAAALEPRPVPGAAGGIDAAAAILRAQLELVRRESSAQLPAAGPGEAIPGTDLLQLLQRTLAGQNGLQVQLGSCAELTLVVDSLALSRALTDLAGRLADNAPAALELRLQPEANGQARLELSWPGREMPRAELQAWSATPLVSDSEGRPLDLGGLLVAAGGGLHFTPASDTADRGLVLLLPTSGGGHGSLRPQIEERPVFYAFDLFRQPPVSAIGRRPLRELTYVVFDTETTGLNPAEGDEIIQLGAIRIVKGRLLFDETVDQLVDPQRSVPASSVAIHGIAPELLVGQPTLAEVLPRFRAFVEGAVMVAHNAAFDMRFLYMQRARTGIDFNQPVLDTLLLSSVVHPHLGPHTLDAIAERFGIPIVGRHTALGDAIVTAEVLLKLIPLLEAQGIATLEEALAASARSPYARSSLDQGRPSDPESR